MSFEKFNLDSSLQKAIEACGYTAPTEIQQQAIPVILQGRDVMASAQTGTGKTAAFVLPMLHKLLTPSSRHGRGPRVLILTPTRELAQQITESIKQLGRFVRLNFGAVVGGVGYGQQESLLRKPLDILVATPGRLMDHMEKGRVDFSRLELFVLDEADRMLDMGFVEDVDMIAEQTPDTRQTLLFSATLEGQVLRVAQRLLKNPERIAISTVQQKHESITQHVHQADDVQHKHALLGHWLSDTAVWQAIVFTATKRGADNLADRLSGEGHAAASLHGDMKQSQRNRTVEQLKRGKVRVLVATDVAARGLDIKGITHVINFDLPRVAEDYVHRIGRTGRGGATGTALSLVGPDDHQHLKRIERMLGIRLDRQVVSGLEPRRPEPRHTRPDNNGRGARGHGKRGGFNPNANRHGRSEQRPFSDRPRREHGPRSEQRTFSDRPRQEHGPRSEQRAFNDRPRHDNAPRSEQRTFNDRPRHDSTPRSEQSARSAREQRPAARRDDNRTQGAKPRFSTQPKFAPKFNDGNQPMRRPRKFAQAE